MYKLGLNSQDIRYFLNTYDKKVGDVLRGKREYDRNIRELRGIKCHGNLSYRKASQIYGFTDEMNAAPEEIANALDIKVDAVEAALQYRNKIEPKLTSALQILFPHERISKPYR